MNACGRFDVDEKLTDSKDGRPLASVSEPVHCPTVHHIPGKGVVTFQERRLRDEAGDQALPLIEIAVAFIIAIGAVVQPHGATREEDGVAARFLILVELVRPGVRHQALQRACEAAVQLHRQRVIPLLTAILHLVDMAVTRVDLVRRQIDRRAEHLPGGLVARVEDGEGVHLRLSGPMLMSRTV